MDQYEPDDGRVRCELFAGAMGGRDGAAEEFRDSGRDLCGGVWNCGGFVVLGEETTGVEWAPELQNELRIGFDLWICVGRSNDQ